MGGMEPTSRRWMNAFFAWEVTSQSIDVSFSWVEKYFIIYNIQYVMFTHVVVFNEMTLHILNRANNLKREINRKHIQRDNDNIRAQMAKM